MTEQRMSKGDFDALVNSLGEDLRAVFRKQQDAVPVGAAIAASTNLLGGLLASAGFSTRQVKELSHALQAAVVDGKRQLKKAKRLDP